MLPAFRVTVPVLFVLLSWGSELSAQEPPDPGELFQRLDRDGDGRLTVDEVPPERRFFYERIARRSDRDGDGSLSREEFTGGVRRGAAAESTRGRQGAARRRPDRGGATRAQAGRIFDRFDRDGSGTITRDELPEPQRRRFDRWLEGGDRDGDGALSRRELARVVSRGAADRARQAPDRGPGRLFRLLDADADGKLSKSELDDASKLLARLDADGDEALSAEEVGAPSARRARRGPGRESAAPRQEPGASRLRGF